jgi:hypothetical protein
MIYAQNDSIWFDRGAIVNDPDFGPMPTTYTRCPGTGEVIGWVVTIGTGKDIVWPLSYGPFDPYFVGGCV